MANLSGLANVTNAATGLSNLLLVTPQSTVGYQPQSVNGIKAKQPPAILFHYEGEQTVTLESDITDHWVEDNSAIQDQIALKPVVITTSGFIGELNDVAPKALLPLKFLADKLTTVAAYTPRLTVAALIAYNEAFFLYSVGANAVNTAVSAWGSITGSQGEAVINGNGIVGSPQNQTKQQIVFQQFFGYWSKRVLFTVQTPWAIFQNMAIKSLRAIQDPDTRTISDFEVTFKAMRFAKTTLTTETAGSFQARAALQAEGLTDLGTSTPIESTTFNDQIGASYPGVV